MSLANLLATKSCRDSYDSCHKVCLLLFLVSLLFVLVDLPLCIKFRVMLNATKELRHERQEYTCETF